MVVVVVVVVVVAVAVAVAVAVVVMFHILSTLKCGWGGGVVVRSLSYTLTCN